MDDRRRWVTDVPACGWWGNLTSNNVMPFVLLKDKLDFGSYLDEETGEATSYSDRYGTIEMSDRLLAPGEEFVLNYDYTYNLVLEQATDIVEKLKFT